MRRSRPGGSRSLLLALLLVAAGCGSGGTPDYVDLDWWAFDQDRDGGWRPVADRGDYVGAARMIETYLAHRDDLLDAQRGYSSFHAGQLWALGGDTERALAHMDRATANEMPADFPRSFNDLVIGSRCFLRGDMAGVLAARDRVAAMPGLAPRDSHFLGALEHLARSEGRTYLEVFEEEMERREER